MATKTTREPTFSLEALNKIVGEQVLAALAKQRAEFEAALKTAKAEKPKNDTAILRRYSSMTQI
jgi:hypothetical protein